jgi:hypothetical protein
MLPILLSLLGTSEMELAATEQFGTKAELSLPITSSAIASATYAIDGSTE